MADRRLFFALWPSDRQRETLRDALRPVLTSVEGRHVDRRNWHVTVVYIGDFPEEQIPFLEAAADEIACDPIRLRFDRLAFWPRAKVACLLPLATPPALVSLVQSVTSVLEAFDRRVEERVYRPHITVARRVVRPFHNQILTRPIDLEWSSFALVESEPAPTGARYRPIWRPGSAHD